MNGWPVFRDVTALLLQCYRQQYSVIVWILLFLFETINLRESGESEKLEDRQNLFCQGLVAYYCSLAYSVVVMRQLSVLSC